MKELSIFIDESGDFGEYEYHSPYYIVSMVFHNQSVDISDDLDKIEFSLKQIGFENHYVHSGPIIRGEGNYRNIDIDTRRTILRKMSTFIRKLEIKFKSFCIEKKQLNNNDAISNRLKKDISKFIKNDYQYFLEYDLIKIYYDNGQSELKKILVEVFESVFSNVEFRLADKNRHRLMEVADYICTIKLIEKKIENNKITKSEEKILGKTRTIKKNYIKPLTEKKLIIRS